MNYPENTGFIPYGRQCLDDADIAAVIDTLKSPFMTQGPAIATFEAALARTSGVSRSVAVCNGTAALHLACLAAEVRPGDEVITSPITFAASANCAAYCGAKPIFADIDPNTYNLTARTVAMKLSSRTRAVIPVHFAGQSCDMAAIRDAVREAEKKYGKKIFIIEDACHALGSRYRGRPVGNCDYADMAAMSFHPVKHVTTGEGGATLTNSEDLARKVALFRSHGITKDVACFEGRAADTDGPWYYEQIELGFNYRITDIQCALGLSQLKKLGEFIARRRQIVTRYNEALAALSWLALPFEAVPGESNFHLYVVLIDFKALGVSRAVFMNKLRERGIGTQVHYIPVYHHPYYRKAFGYAPGECPNAETYYERCLSLPLYPAMSDADVEKVIDAVREAGA